MAYIVIVSKEGGEIGRAELSGPLVIGRATECDLAIHDILLSRKHCRLLPSRGGWVAMDLESRNGTFVNGHRVMREPLSDGDELRVGRTRIKFSAGVPPWAGKGERKRKKAPRPADPHEALAGTVTAFEYNEATDALPPPRPVPMGRDKASPKPAPLKPAAYDAEGVGTMVLEMLSDLHDTFSINKPRKSVRPGPKPMIDSAWPADAAAPTIGRRAAERARPSTPAEATALESTARVAESLRVAAVHVLPERRVHRGPLLGLTFWMVLLATSLAAAVSASAWQLLRLP